MKFFTRLNRWIVRATSQGSSWFLFRTLLP
jgi:hypothetical protein